MIVKYADNSLMVAMCDSNIGRMRLSLDQIVEKKGARPPGYTAKELDRIIEETRPNCVIVTSRDNTHSHFICRAMELGCDVI